MPIDTTKLSPHLRPFGAAVKGLADHLRQRTRHGSHQSEGSDAILHLEKHDQWTDRLSHRDHRDLEHFARIW